MSSEATAADAVRVCRSEEETMELGRELVGRLGADGVVLLEGPMGAGKTVLARGVADALGVDPVEIQSPTFTLVHEHVGHDGVMLYHLDLYRLDPSEVAALGADEILEGPGFKVVEWAERLPAPPPGGARLVARRTEAGTRTFEIHWDQREERATS